MSKILLILTMMTGGLATYQFSNKTTVSDEIATFSEVNKPFEIKFNLEKLSEKEYYLVATLALEEENFTVSPFSADSFYLPLTIHLDRTEQLKPSDNILEIPNSIPEVDPIINKVVRFVRDNTTYKQSLEVLSESDFKTTGFVELLVEPSCVPYYVEFDIIYQNGDLAVEKTETKIAPYYKGK